MSDYNDRWNWMQEELDSLKARGQYRELRNSASLEEGWIRRDGSRMLNLASNHYLGLPQGMNTAYMEQLEASAHRAGTEIRVGATASRLVVGNDPIYERLEHEFAAFKGTESSLIYSSGYMANMGVISALVGRNDVVFSDKLNHASIVDGVLLSRAEHLRYRHRDLDQLEAMLKREVSERASMQSRKRLIVTDAVFSMDGSLAPLEELVWLKERYGAMLMVDEAHSGGVFGTQGQGLTHALGLTKQVDVQMGTFSKAYGCCGAYVAGDAVLIKYLVNSSRQVIYNTALPSVILLAIEANWKLALQEQWRRDALRTKSKWFREELQRSGFNTGLSECQIVPLIVGGNADTLTFSERLQAEGIAAVAIRPPTVPEGSARIRFTVTATHQVEDLEWAIERIRELGKSLGLIR